MRFTIATYNIHKGFTQLNRRMVIHELRDRLVGLDPDILFLQEVVGGHERHAARHVDWPVKPQHEFIAGSVWQRGRLRQERDPPPRPPRQRRAVALPDRRPREPGHLGAPVRKPGPAALRDPAGPQPPVAALHQRPPGPVRARAAMADARAVRAHRGHGAQGCAAGDRRRLQRLAAQGEPDAGRRARASTRCSRPSRAVPARTFPSVLPMFRLDRIYARGLAIVDAHVHCAFPRARLSDHAALAATFETPKRAR